MIVLDGKLDRDVKPGGAVIDGKLEIVNILPSVDLRVVKWCIITGFSGVFDILGLVLVFEVSIADVNVMVLCTDEEDEEKNLVDTLVQVLLGDSEVEISKVVAVIELDVGKDGDNGKLDEVIDGELNSLFAKRKKGFKGKMYKFHNFF